jgi:hypothetical protein
MRHKIWIFVNKFISSLFLFVCIVGRTNKVIFNLICRNALPLSLIVLLINGLMKCQKFIILVFQLFSLHYESKQRSSALVLKVLLNNPLRRVTDK